MLALACCGMGTLLGTAPALRAAEPAAAESAAAPRIELRSPEYLLVGLVHGDVLNLRLSRANDNAPVADAEITATLRGASYPLIAQADGSYAFTAKDLAVPGPAGIEFHILRGAAQDTLRGTLQLPVAPKDDDRSSFRQNAWWALNFAVCIAAYWLFTRRRKAHAEADTD
jgi:hypothetical protein